MKKLFPVIFLLLFGSQMAFGQLSNFVLTVTKTDESCTGNASLSFNVTNTAAGSTIIYRIYRLPDDINSIAVLSTNTFGGLAAGAYRVVATQTLGSNSGSQQQDITILDTRTFVTYEVTGTQTSCDEGTLNVTVLSGNPASYEIINGPVTVPPQPSGSFPGLHAGTYNVRVNDACGEGVVQTYTLALPNPPNLAISPPTTGCQLATCNSIGVSFSVTTENLQTNIRYPLTVQLTILPPGNGAPIVQNQTITSGGLNSLTVSDIIPFYHAQLYSFNIRIVDACGNVYVRNGNQINQQLVIQGELTFSGCIKGIRFGVCTFLPPYTLNFLSAPAGFNPVDYNGQHPGPFTSETTGYISLPGNEIPNGTYSVQVTDACNRTATCEIVVHDLEPGYTIMVDPLSCEINTFIQIPRDISAGPFIVSAVITASTANLGSPIPYDVTSNISSGILLMQLPPGTYTIQGVDVCGHAYSYTFTMPPKAFSVTANPINITGCSASALGGIRVIATGALLMTVTITQAPAGFGQPLPYSVPIPSTGAPTALIASLPAGDYVLSITDSCNNSYIKNATITASISVEPLVFLDKKGCGENYDSISLTSPNGGLQTVIITAAPSSFPFSLPYNVSFNIASNGTFYMNAFPEGSYTFYTKDICNQERTTAYTLTGYHHGGSIDVINNCGAFDLNMSFSDNATNQANLFWLQKFDPLTNQWTHPLTGVVYPPNSLPNNLNSYQLENLTVNYNIAATGTFRVLARTNYYNNGSSQLISCIQTVKTFDYNGELRILNAYAIPCISGGSQVFIITNGAPPLNYQVTTRNDQPFLINNGTSNSFSGLQPGTYNFRVQDVCGNIVNRLLDINTLQEPEITSSNLCEGLNGQLSVQPFSFLNYEWWKEGSPGTILSTTNTLTFNPYTSANTGIYHVRIYSTTLNSCVDRVLTYTLSPASSPNAGLDGSRVICGNASTVNLFTVLNGSYDTGGTWQEITSSGALIGSNWMPGGLPLGTYIFRYTVNGFCNATDDATVTITLHDDVAIPVINADTSFCTGEDIAFSVQAIPNAVYQWSGPDGFSSSLQNPVLTNANAANAGTYTVTATVGQCQSQAEITIANKPLPDYTYEKSCDTGIFTVEIISTEGSLFDPASATYLWTGPNNFSSTGNPLLLTNQPAGDYNVVVTSNEGCPMSQTIGIASTFCDFPNVITPGGDGYNDSFDLSNYDVELFQVFSRWGRLVYEERNYIKGWYGQNMHGGYLPDSTYYYFVRLKNGQEKHGWIFVGRG